MQQKFLSFKCFFGCALLHQLARKKRKAGQGDLGQHWVPNAVPCASVVGLPRANMINNRSPQEGEETKAPAGMLVQYRCCLRESFSASTAPKPAAGTSCTSRTRERCWGCLSMPPCRRLPILQFFSQVNLPWILWVSFRNLRGFSFAETVKWVIVTNSIFLFFAVGYCRWKPLTRRRRSRIILTAFLLTARVRLRLVSSLYEFFGTHLWLKSFRFDIIIAT